MLRVALWALVLLGLGGAKAQADVVVNVQFGTSANIATAYTGAAVVGTAGDYWNPISAFPGTTAVALKNTNNISSGVGLKSTINGSTNDFYGGTTGWNGAPSLDVLMNNYIGTNAVSTAGNTFTFSGLNAGQLYDVYIYTQPAASGRRLGANVGGETKTTNLSVAPSGSFIENQNYLRFQNKITNASGDLTLSYWSGVTFGVVNGIQIVAVPEPGTLLLGGIAAACGGGGVWWKRRKRPAAQPAPTEAESEAGSA